MLGKVFNMVSNASASQPLDLDLQRLLAQPAAAMDHEKMTMACHQRQRNSSSNTSHSQTSSYTNDDSHSGDQGSDSGGSGADHSPLQDQAPRSPGRSGSNRWAAIADTSRAVGVFVFTGCYLPGCLSQPLLVPSAPHEVASGLTSGSTS